VEIISHFIWLYYRFALSLRDISEMMLERGGGTARIRNPDSSCRGLPTRSPLTSNERAAR
jgi:hypothetical protein